MAKYRYGWVFSKSYEDICSLELQREELLKLGIPYQNIRLEIGRRSWVGIGFDATRTVRERPIFQKLVNEELQQNDILVVTERYRCSDTPGDFLKLHERIYDKILFICL